MNSWAAIPSPAISALKLGPLSFHFYALCIIAGIVIAVRLGEKRFIARGGNPGDVTTIAFWAVPAGIIGGRIYHILTSWGSFSSPLDAIAIWRGGLGIWGAIAVGTAGAWLGYKSLLKDGRSLPSFGSFLDALAPGVLLAQAIGRWGNWFNIELFGKPLTAPWALQVPLSDRPMGYSSFATFHPTFLYESLWCVCMALILLKLDKSGFFSKNKSGTLFIGYIFLYTLGRGVIEMLRIDSSSHILGMRLNFWTSLIIFTVSLTWFMVRKLRPER